MTDRLLARAAGWMLEAIGAADSSGVEVSDSDLLGEILCRLVTTADPPWHWEEDLALLAGPATRSLVVQLRTRGAAAANAINVINEAVTTPQLQDELSRFDGEVRKAAIAMPSRLAASGEDVLRRVTTKVGVTVVLGVVANLLTDMARNPLGTRHAQTPLTPASDPAVTRNWPIRVRGSLEKEHAAHLGSLVAVSPIQVAAIRARLEDESRMAIFYTIDDHAVLYRELRGSKGNTVFTRQALPRGTFLSVFHVYSRKNLGSQVEWKLRVLAPGGTGVVFFLPT